jgi:hypothetical protein
MCNNELSIVKASMMPCQLSIIIKFNTMDTSQPSQYTIEYYNLYRNLIKETFLLNSIEKIKDTLLFLNKVGLDRKNIYSLLLYINRNDETLTEEQSDSIGEVLDVLSGFCIIEQALEFIKFIDDPEDKDERMKYIGSIAYGWA